MKISAKLAACISLYLIFIVALVGCRPRYKVMITEEVENQDSTLINYLIQRTDFNDSQWVWLLDTTLQTTSLPSSNNSFLVDEAERGIDGYYAEKENFVSFWHTLSCYGYSALPSLLVFNFESQYQTYDIPISPVGEDFVSQCKKSDVQVVCETVTKYGNVSSKLSVDIRNALSEEASFIVNEILSKLDVRLSSVPHCYDR